MHSTLTFTEPFIFILCLIKYLLVTLHFCFNVFFNVPPNKEKKGYNYKIIIFKSDGKDNMDQRPEVF